MSDMTDMAFISWFEDFYQTECPDIASSSNNEDEDYTFNENSNWWDN